MSTKSYLFDRAPIWNRHIRTVSQQPPANLQSWLEERGSLTKRLRGIYGTDLKVRLLFHQWKPAFADECRQLQMPYRRFQLIREVLLHAGSTPLVLARTILPEPTIRIAHRNLSHLGTRPLGEVIFAYPDLERRQRDFSCATTVNWSSAIRRSFEVDRPVWGRRSLYAIHDQPLLVAEFFLPGLFKDGAIRTS